MSSDDARITPSELADLEDVRHISTLTLWEQDPYGAADVGTETLAQFRLGQSERLLVHGDIVLWGGVMVAAEYHEPRNDGMVAVVDVSNRWSLREAKAEVLRRFRRARDVIPDDTMLAELLTELARADMDLLNSIGIEGDDVDDLLRDLEAKDSEGIGGGDDKDKSVLCPSCGCVVTL
jgi:hypothetical protein